MSAKVMLYAQSGFCMVVYILEKLSLVVNNKLGLPQLWICKGPLEELPKNLEDCLMSSVTGYDCKWV
jgi:hypothetical protein